MNLGYVCVMIAIVLMVLLGGCVPDGLDEPDKTAPVIDLEEIQSLKEYEQSIDYSCEVAEDCLIRDVGNCCGHYPRCVNRDATTYPGLVKKFCVEQQFVSVCGFSSISACECVSGTCVSTQ